MIFYNKRRGLTIWLFTIVIFALNLFLKISSSWSLYGDEPFTLFFSQQSFANIIDRLANDSNPFLHPFLLHIWLKVFGVTVFSGKLFSAVLSSLTGALLFKLFSKRLGFIASLIAAVLFTIREPHWGWVGRRLFS